MAASNGQPQPAPENAQFEDFPQLLCVSRIVRLPFVDSGIGVVRDIYDRIKTSNAIVKWSLTRAERTMTSALQRTLPVALALETPLALVDAVLCRSLDLIEEAVPVVVFPPELILVSTKDYVNDHLTSTKDYVSDHLVRPVLRRADSMKAFGLEKATTVLQSKYTSTVALKIDSALDIADKLVDQYLPGDAEAKDEVDGATVTSSQAAHALNHVDVFSRKLQRRLTRRTIAEATALKRQSVDAASFMINMAELLAKDPKAAMQKAALLWAHLSEDEPENQARPQNLEQLTVMVSRELARRVVHLVNFARDNIGNVPDHAAMALLKTVHTFSVMADTVVKRTRLEGARRRALSHTRLQVSKLQEVLASFNAFASQLLVVVVFVSTIRLVSGRRRPKGKYPRYPRRPRKCHVTWATAEVLPKRIGAC